MTANNYTLSSILYRELLFNAYDYTQNTVGIFSHQETCFFLGGVLKDIYKATLLVFQKLWKDPSYSDYQAGLFPAAVATGPGVFPFIEHLMLSRILYVNICFSIIPTTLIR